MKYTQSIIVGLFLSSPAWTGVQSAQFEIPLTVTDNAGGSRQLYCGVDPAGTDGIDGSLGEQELPPFSITGAFDARFVGDDIGINIGQGLWNDYRQGNVNTIGNRIHELRYQVGNGSTITITWNMPSWATGRLQDIITGALIDVSMAGSGNYTINNPGGFNKLKLTITYTAPLPVQLVSFTGSVINQDGHVRLNWRTLSETNNYAFYVQRAQATLNNYLTISPLIPGHGTTLEPHDYDWTDTSAGSGTRHYRLKQIDLDGTYHFSEPIVVENPTSADEPLMPAKFELKQNYPNPFNPSTEIRFSVETSGHTRLTVFNIAGQQVGSLFDDWAIAGQYYKVKFDASDLASGVYLYRLQSGGLSSTKKFVLMR